MELTNNY